MSKDRMPKFRRDDEQDHRRKKKSNRPPQPYIRKRKHSIDYREYLGEQESDPVEGDFIDTEEEDY